MPLNVTDLRANKNENIVHAAKIIGRSRARRNVFETIYRGKKKTKTVKDIMKETGLDNIRVLQEGRILAANQIVEKIKKDGRIAYNKYESYTHDKNKILSLVDKPKNISKVPTKSTPQQILVKEFHIRVSGKVPKIENITIDDIDSYSKVRNYKYIDASIDLTDLPEEIIKKGLQNIIGDNNIFRDWGGEKSDIYTNKLLYKGKRKFASFALKGKATQGTLTPTKMGKNGDQIGRLFASTADIFIIVYHSKIEESIVSQMEAFSIGKAIGGKTVYYCTIDGDDLNRLYQAYEDCF